MFSTRGRAAATRRTDTFKLQFYCMPWPPRTQEEAQMLYDHIRTTALIMDSLPSLLKLPFLQQIPYWSWISRIPGIGLDSLVTLLLPIVGSGVGLVLATYQVILSMLFGLPTEIIVWMFLYILADAAIGVVPLIGPLLDAFFTASLYNLSMLEKHLKRTRPSIKIPARGAQPEYPQWFTKVFGATPQRRM